MVHNDKLPIRYLSIIYIIILYHSWILESMG